MNVFSFFAFAVYAAEAVISPIPDILATPTPMQIEKPSISFGELFPTPTPLPTATPIPIRTTRTSSMTIALLGDSMIDTLGPDGGGVAKKLNVTYPNTTFTIRNHGVGAENIDSGLHRLTNDYSYLDVPRQAILSQRPDIIVIESFGYNPYPYETGAIDNHWGKLGEMVDVITSHLPETKIVIAATIAPNWDVFGDGAPFLSMSPEGKREKVETINRYIESTIGFAKAKGLPIADAYHQSLDRNGNGRLEFINGGDHIHYSQSGRNLFATTLARTLIANKLLE